MKYASSAGWHRLLSSRLSTLACAMALAGGLAGGLAPAAQAAQPTSAADAAGVASLADFSAYYDASCTCYRNVPYGKVKWKEVALGITLRQDFDVFLPANAPPGPRPVVVWAHANGATKTIAVNDSVYRRIVKPALANGFAVVSIEFRHPVVNDYLGAPHYDVAKAIQYLRSVAPDFSFDTNNFFAAGRSRGMLSLWTALQDDLADPDGDLRAQQSTRVNAVFGYQGETTYSTTEVANTFIVPQDRARFLTRNPDNPGWGSALQSATADDPPVLLRYEDAFWNRLVRATEISSHHSDFGLELCVRYTALGIGASCTAEDLIPGSDAYLNYIDFFIANLKPPAP